MRSTQLLLVAALRHCERHPPPVQRQRLGHEILLGQSVAEQDEGRLRPVVVELADKGGQHLLDRELSVMAGEIGAIAPIVAAAEKKYLHAGMTPGLMRRDDVGIGKAGDMDVLVSLHQRERAYAVADQRRGLEVERLGGAVHLGRQTLLDVAAAPGQKQLRLLDQPRVIVAFDPADAGRAAALDLMQQAGTGPIVEHTVAA